MFNKKTYLTFLLLSIIYLSFNLNAGETETHFKFRITNTSGDLLEGVSVSYVVTGARRDSIRTYVEDKSTDYWQGNANTRYNASLKRTKVIFVDDVVTFEFRFVKYGYESVSVNIDLDPNMGFYGPTTHVELEKKDNYRNAESRNRDSGNSRNIAKTDGFNCKKCSQPMSSTPSKNYYCKRCKSSETCTRCKQKLVTLYHKISETKLALDSYSCRNCNSKSF